MSALYPPSPRETLLSHVDKSIRQVPLPAAVVNLAAVRRNCARMLAAVDALGLSWRAHVKTHKTVEVTRLQVGEDVARPANLVVSTVAEAEFLGPLLREWQSQGRKVNVLYGLPIASNAVPRLAVLARTLGEGSISILLDDPAHIPLAGRLHELSGVKAHAYLKIDMGGRRAGVVVGGGGGGERSRLYEVVDAALGAHARGEVVLAGLYSHAGHSYGGDSRVAALAMMRAEMQALLEGADKVRGRAAEKGVEIPALVLSGGASPTTLSIQNLLGGNLEPQGQRKGQGQEAMEGDPALQAEVDALSRLLDEAKSSGHVHVVEVHAGVYPFLDLQQLATHSITAPRLSWQDMALTIVAEVHSTYPGRGAGGTPEALVGAGSLVFGREACKAYAGMAVLSPWGRPGVGMPACDVEEFRGWTLGRFSQEHGILTWTGDLEGEGMGGMDGLEVGQRVRLWPNHACIAGSQFGWYYVVDEDREGREDEIVDIWARARGW